MNKCSCGQGCNGSIPSDLGPKIAEAASAFAAVVGRLPNGFACPICLREVDPGCVTRAHFPAASAGGRRTTLACKACNNSIGTAFERDAELWHSKKSAGTTLSTSGVTGLKIELNTSENPFVGNTPINIEVLGAAGAGLLERLRSDLEEGGQFRIGFHGAPPDRIRLAVLSWAYLCAFADFGYAFALQPSQRQIRSWLLDPSSEVPPTIVLNPDPPSPDGPGELSLVLAHDGDPSHIRLLGLGIHFGRAIGVLPIADDLALAVYRHLEQLVLEETKWKVLVEPISSIVKGPQGTFADGKGVTTWPYVVVGVGEELAKKELLGGSITPQRRRGTRRRTVTAPEQPSGELPHSMTMDQWEALSNSGNHGQQYLSDLLRIAVHGEDPGTTFAVFPREVESAIDRLRARYPLGSRPRVHYRGLLMERDGRELVWIWGRISWPDGSEADVGPVFSYPALIEEIARKAAPVDGSELRDAVHRTVGQ